MNFKCQEKTWHNKIEVLLNEKNNRKSKIND